MPHGNCLQRLLQICVLHCSSPNCGSRIDSRGNVQAKARHGGYRVSCTSIAGLCNIQAQHPAQHLPEQPAKRPAGTPHARVTQAQSLAGLSCQGCTLAEPTARVRPVCVRASHELACLPDWAHV